MLLYLIKKCLIVIITLLILVENLAYCHNSTQENQKLIADWRSKNQTLDLTDKEQAWFDKETQDDISTRSGLPPAQRKEYRCMSDKERYDFHAVMNELKKDLVDPEMGTSPYDVFTMKHRYSSAPGAHDGPGFLCFHRIHLYYLEKLIRSRKPSLFLPYWDSTLDSDLPNPSHSMLWTESYLGTSYGPVRKGFMKDWKAVPFECEAIGFNLKRECGNDRTLLMNDNKIRSFIYKYSFEDATTPKDPSFESSHGDVHLYMGGHMAELMCSPNDLVFYMHHCFCDLIFDVFQKRHPGSPYPQTDIAYHHSYDPVYPYVKFSVGEVYYDKNFTRDKYNYVPRPYGCMSHQDCCGSKALFCDFNEKRCKAKVFEGGECGSLPHDSCHCDDPTKAGYCSSQVCSCHSGCKLDSDCPESEYCNTASHRCTKKERLGHKCEADYIPNNACYGSCNTKDPNVQPMCYRLKCICVRLRYSSSDSEN